MSQVRERAIILGPHPGNGMFSISNYFKFCQQTIARFIPELDFDVQCPGDLDAFHRDRLLESSRISSWWDSYAKFPWKLKSLRSDLFHIVDQGLGWYGYFLNGGARLITVHDLIMYMNLTGKLSFEKVPRQRAFLMRRSISQIKKADRIISVSRHTADCLVRELGVSAKRISIVHNPVNPAFLPLSPQHRATVRKRWFGSAEHVVIHVGKPLSYKNRIGALRSFDLVRKRLPGAAMFLTSDAVSADEQSFFRESSAAKSIFFKPGLSNAELREFYGAGDALIFPSRYEGFGWPPLEAMACGCPVVSTTCASLEEVVGDAALTVKSPSDIEGLAMHLETVLKDGKTAAELRMRGFERVKRFQFDQVAAQLAEIYRDLLSSQ